MRKLIIVSLDNGKRHYRTIKYNGSIRFGVEGNHIVIRDYYTSKKIHSFNIVKYGSIKYWVE